MNGFEKIERDSLSNELFITQGVGRIVESGLDGLKTNRQNRDCQGCQAGQNKNMNTDVDSVSESLQPAPHQKIGDRPGNHIGGHNPAGELNRQHGSQLSC